MRRRDSGSARGDKGKSGGRSAGRSGARSNDSREKKSFSRSRNDRDESKPKRSGFSGEKSERRSSAKDFSKPNRKSFGRSRGEGFSSREERPFSRSRDDRDESNPGRSKFSGEERGERKSFGGKSFSRSRDTRNESNPGRSKFSGEERGERKSYEKKSFSRSRDNREESKPRRRFSEDEKGERKGFSTPRGEKAFDRDNQSPEKKGFFSKLSRGGKTYERRHDPDFGKSVKDFSNQKEEAKDSSSDKIRLNRYISNSGVCSRREADELIKMGLVSVNGTVITEMGYKVNRGDSVKYEGKTLRAERPVYILLNKPKGFLTTTKDPQERNTVMQIIAGAVKERVYPVGRLDRNTTGLLLLTNDGELTDKLSHPSYNVKKIYKAELDKPLTKADFQKIKDGIQLEEGKAMVDDLAIVSDDGKTVGIEIHIGWNRVIRRIFERLEYQVVKLDRSVYAGLDKKDLSRGHWRFLTKEEVVRLKHYK